MVQPTKLSENFAVSPQLTETDFDQLATAGYKTVINNRPNGEEAGQLTATAAQKIAQENDLNYVHIPVKMPEITKEAVEQFSQAIKENPGPILAHCKTGTRSAILWTITQAQQTDLSLDELMQRTAQQGYDLTKMRPLIEQHVSEK